MLPLHPNPYCIVPRSAVPPDEWDDFVLQKSDEAWLWHLSDFQDVMIDRGLQDLSFAVRSSSAGEILSVMPLHRRKRKELGLFYWYTAHSHGGPAVSNQVGEKKRKSITSLVKSHLQKTAEEHQLTEITISLPPAAPAYRGERCPRVNPLLYYDCECSTEPAWMVSLLPKMEDVRRAYNHGTRKNINNAESFTIFEAQDTSDLMRYYELHLDTCKRTGDQPHPFHYFKTTFERFLPKRRCRILFFIKDGRTMAAQCTGLLKGGANYWFGASVTDKPKHGGENQVLFDRQFESARAAGVEWYFMGEAFIKGNLAGISEFKGSFGSQLFPYYHGRIIYNLWRRRFFSHITQLTGYSK